MKKILAILVMVAGFASGITLAYGKTASACWFCTSTEGASDQQQAEQNHVVDNQSKMESAVPLPQLDNSLERINISKRLTTFNDANKISYIYLVNYGRVMAFYTIKGKVTSGSKRLTSSQRIVGDGYSTVGQFVIESPELDGTYGSSAPYIYFWTTDGVYVQWSGDYMLADQPMQLTTQPEIVRTIK